jgi:pimeloyl-ACP methyl ester carboxylesterase
MGLIVAAAALLCSCVMIRDLESGMSAITYPMDGGGFCNLYHFKRGEGRTLIVLIGGSGYGSVLGTRRGDYSSGYGCAGLLSLGLSRDFDMVTPEKPNVSPYEDENSREAVLVNYTVDRLATVYAMMLDDFLSQNDYGRVVVFGHSEGGALVPAIYARLGRKERVQKLVVSGAGLLSEREALEILAVKGGGVTFYDINELGRCIGEVMAKPDSIADFWMGHPYKRWASFLLYEPYRDAIRFSVPMLLAHGTDDTSTPVECSRKSADMLKALKLPVEYLEFSGGHDAPFDHLPELEKWMRS